MSLKRGESKIDTLYVGIEKRTQPAPGEKDIKGNVFSVTKDGNEIYRAPFITLEVGITYKFVINTPGYPFYITTHSTGGGVQLKPMQSMIGAIDITPESTGELGNVGIEKGTLRWSPKREHSQMKLYYQCNYYPHMGNSVVVKIPE